MNARAFRQEFESDDEFFRYHSGCHGRDRSLSSLWQLLNTTPLPSSGQKQYTSEENLR